MAVDYIARRCIAQRMSRTSAGRRPQVTVPTSAPIPAVTAIATAPQATTRTVARRRGAPPSRAPRSPSSARATSVTATVDADARPRRRQRGGQQRQRRARRERQRRRPRGLQRARQALLVEPELVAGVRLQRAAARERRAPPRCASSGGRPRRS